MASSAHPDAVLVMVPRTLEESINLGFVCDWLWTASIGRALLVLAPVLPPLVLDFTLLCLVVLQLCTFPRCLIGSTDHKAIQSESPL